MPTFLCKLVARLNVSTSMTSKNVKLLPPPYPMNKVSFIQIIVCVRHRLVEN